MDPKPGESKSSPLQTVLDVDRQMARISRRSFLWGAAAVAAGAAAYGWLTTRMPSDGILWPLRRTLQFNEAISESLFSAHRLAPTFPVSMAREPKQNGDLGLPDDFDAETWKLSLIGAAGATSPIALTLEQIKQLPRVDMVTEHKCVEGWSVIVHWAGARFLDFATRYPPPTQTGEKPDVLQNPEALVRYVGMKTPDGGYYIGLDMKSALHPQTLLCYEMNGAELTDDHGAPLRLVIPVKYGIKSIKRIGSITYGDSRPADYWAEQGYDWYAGH